MLGGVTAPPNTSFILSVGLVAGLVATGPGVTGPLAAAGGPAAAPVGLGALVAAGAAVGATVGAEAGVEAGAHALTTSASSSAAGARRNDPVTDSFIVDAPWSFGASIEAC